jgi:hypothetical protein
MIFFFFCCSFIFLFVEVNDDSETIRKSLNLFHYNSSYLLAYINRQSTGYTESAKLLMQIGGSQRIKAILKIRALHWKDTAALQWLKQNERKK